MNYRTNVLRISHFPTREVGIMPLGTEKPTAFAQRTRLAAQWK